MKTGLYIVVLYVFALMLPSSCSGKSDPAPVKPQEQKPDNGGDVTLVTFSTASSRTVNPDIYGFNTQTAAGPSWSDPKFMDMLRELRPANLRYPGGTIGNYMDWSTGQYMAKDLRDPALKAPRKPLNGPDGSKTITTYRLEELKNGIQATGAAPIYMVNMLTDVLSSTESMLARAVSLGLPVKYIELGNEFYLSYTQGGSAPNTLGDYCTPFHYPTAQSYADEAKRYITEIKKLYPDVKIAYNAVVDEPKQTWFNSSPRTVEWNSVMKAANMGADAVVIHLYSENSSTPEGLIANSLSKVATFNDFTASTWPGMRIWVTEYNVKCDKLDNGDYRNAFAGQWVHGLNSAIYTAELMLSPQVDLLCFHDIAADVPAAVIFAQNGDIPTSQSGGGRVPVSAMTFSASGYAFTMLGYAAQGATQIAKLSASPAQTVGAIDALFGYLFTGSNRRALLVNLSAESRAIDSRIPAGSGAAVSSIQYSAPALTTVVNSADKLTRAEVALTGNKVTLPPYSITVLSY